MSETRTAGRALDAEVAEKVFGYWQVQEYEGRLVHGESNMNGWPCDTPEYSTEIAAAWQIVDHMQAHGWRLKLTRYTDDWYATFARDNIDGADWSATQVPTTALAICLAALSAIEVPTETRA